MQAAQESSSASSSDVRNELAEKIAVLLNGLDKKPLILGLLADYEVTKKERGLILYNGGETDYYIKRFIVAKRVAGCTERTCKLYFRNLQKVFNTIGKSPKDIDHTDVQKYIACMIAKKNSKAYQQNIHHTLSSFFAWMTREELVQKNIMLKVDSIKAKPPHKKAFTDMEVEKIRAACDTKRETCLVEVLLSTGLRVFEIAKLRIDEIHGETAQVVGKGEKERTVYFNAKAQIAIAAYLAERKDHNPYLFPASIKIEGYKGTMKMNKLWYTLPEQVTADKYHATSSIEAILRQIGKKAGVENCHPHRFRRTCATFALRRGMPVTLVQLMLGHDNISTTQRYLDIEADELKTAHQKFVT